MTKIKNLTNKIIPINGKTVKPGKTIKTELDSKINYLIKNNVFEIVKEIESQNEQNTIKEDNPEPTLSISDKVEEPVLSSDSIPQLKRRGRRKKIKLNKEDDE